MSYTREQLNKVLQAKRDELRDRLRDELKSNLASNLARTMLLVGVLASIGALAGLALSFLSVPPLIAGGIIGSTGPIILIALFCAINADSFQKTKNHRRLEEMFEEGRIFKEYINSTEYKVKHCVSCITGIGVAFGIGAGLVALGFTSPVAISIVTLVATIVVYYPLSLLTDKVIECFFPEVSEQPSSSVSNAKVNDANVHNRCPNC